MMIVKRFTFLLVVAVFVLYLVFLSGRLIFAQSPTLIPSPTPTPTLTPTQGPTPTLTPTPTPDDFIDALDWNAFMLCQSYLRNS